MKVFVIGNSNSFWFKYYLETIVLPRYDDVSIFVESEKEQQFLDFYKQNNVHVFSVNHYNKLILKLPKIRSIYMRRRKIKSISGKFDLVIVLSCRIYDMMIALAIKKKNGKVVSIFTGSDILKNNHRSDVKLNKLLTKCDSTICASAENPANKVRQLPYVKQKGCTVIPFGLVTLSMIDKYRDNNLDAFKKEFLIPVGKTIVCVGYNARSEQQHIKVIESLKNLPDEFKKQIAIILPLTYLREETYLNVLKTFLASTEFNSVTLDKFMNQEDMAKLWLSCDVFINSQTCDAMSASVIEALHAGVEVVSGSWLKYPELEKIGVHIDQFDNFADLPNLIEQAIKKHKNKDSKIAKQGYNTSLDDYRKSWNEIYDKVDSLLEK